MKRVKILNIVFTQEIKTKQIPSFRSAVLRMLGDADVAFHNHTEDEKFVYDYPKIQYKTFGNKASMFCIEEGVEKIYSLFNLKSRNIIINGVQSDLVVEDLKANEFVIQAWDTYFDYKISSWLALNEKNYGEYKKLKSEAEKFYFLENILRGNILSFGKGVDCIFDKEVKVQITKINKEYTSDFKGIKMHTINAEFKSNVFLPNHLGLGKGVSIGFGVVKEKRKNNYINGE